MPSNETHSLKVGIVGCGNMAKVHVRIVGEYVQKASIAVCDRDELRLKEFASHNGISATFTDVLDMLLQFKPDVVHIITPPATHTDIAILCLEKGAHVVLEKPMCVTTDEADRIIEAMDKAKRLVCVDHMRSFDPFIRRARAMIDAGHIGQITNINVGYSYDYLKRVDTDAAARWINKLPGGSFFDLLPHLLCLLNDFLPAIHLEESATRRDASTLITELLGIFSSARGTGTLHMSLNVYPLKNYVEFEGTNGILRVDFRNFLFILRKNYGLPNAVERIVENLSIGWQYIAQSLASVFRFVTGKLDPYAGLDWIIRGFYTAVEQHGQSPVPPQKARQLLVLTEGMFAREDESPFAHAHVNRLKASDVLVTGGTGFIGRRVVNRLLETGHAVRVFSHRFLSAQELKELYVGEVDFFQGEIFQPRDIGEACKGVGTVYHLAAAMRGDWNYHLDTTITGTKNILEAAHNSGVKRFVHFSTLNVYDAKRYPNNKSIDEDFGFEDTPEKRGAYSHAKLRAETVVREFMKVTAMSIVMLRPGLVYGPGAKPLPGDVGMRIGRKLLLVFGIGSRRLPLVYVDDVVDAALLAGELRDESRGGVFNVVDPEYPSQRRYIAQYRKLTADRFIVLYVPLWIVYSGFWLVERVVAVGLGKEVSLCYKLRCIAKSPRHSTKKIEDALGWKPRVKFDEGMSMTLPQARW